MYKHFYGFKERPFKLVPNPLYLFLSKSHEEALGHLHYAVKQGDGFVEITGEVGTGKTTLLRVFLDKLGDDTEAAYIFNPKLNSIQLLKTINDEFGIDSNADNTKDLIDILNEYLIKKKAEQKKVILLIDEAQNLSIEVLEQLRLLSNLETTQSKLLQIILVGQPELGEMLDSHELRQLGQRITLSCHLTPLTYKETKAYIKHRISVASHKPSIKFSRAAYSLIYLYSKGIPRLINIVCDRALLSGFTQDKKKITKNIVNIAIKELTGRRAYKIPSLWMNKKTVSLLLGLCLILIAVTLFPPEILNREKAMDRAHPTSQNTDPSMPGEEKNRVVSQAIKIFDETEQTLNDPIQVEEETETGNDDSDSNAIIPEKEEILSEPERQEEITDSDKEILAMEEQDKIALAVEEELAVVNQVTPVEENDQELKELLQGLDTNISRFLAIKTLIDIWNTGSGLKHYFGEIENDLEFFRLAARQGGLKVNRVIGDFKLISVLNLPVILKLYLPDDSAPRYLTISWLEDNHPVFTLSERQITSTLKELSLFWRGEIYIVWKDFFNYTGSIPLNAPKNSILTLKMHLKEIGFDNIELNSIYDETAWQAVTDIQRKNGLTVDGIVGPLTKIVLYNKKNNLKIPHITQKLSDDLEQN